MTCPAPSRRRVSPAYARKAVDRTAIEWLCEDYDVGVGSFSPDGRFLAFISNEDDREKFQVYARPFDASKPDVPAGDSVQISRDGANGMVAWRQDGKEMYFLTQDWEVMKVDVATAPTVQAGVPKVLFKLSGPLPGNPGQWKNVSRDGERFVFAMPMARGAPR